MIVGNQMVDHNRRLLSRQVLQVTVSEAPIPVGDRVRIHVATPYGVSRELDVPLIPTTTEKEKKDTLTTPTEGYTLGTTAGPSWPR